MMIRHAAKTRPGRRPAVTGRWPARSALPTNGPRIGGRATATDNSRLENVRTTEATRRHYEPIRDNSGVQRQERYIVTRYRSGARQLDVSGWEPVEHHEQLKIIRVFIDDARRPSAQTSPAHVDTPDETSRHCTIARRHLQFSVVRIRVWSTHGIGSSGRSGNARPYCTTSPPPSPASRSLHLGQQQQHPS